VVAQQRELVAVSEGGLYTLILRSRDATKPGTVPHRFRRWITGDVLPAIRKTGGYKASDKSASPEAADDAEAPDGLRIRMVTEARQSFGEGAAQQLWFRLKLPVVPAMLGGRPQGDFFDGGTEGTH